MILPDDAPLFVSQSPADFRKSYDGLSGLVINSLGRNPTDGSLYAFFNRNRTQVKVLYYRSGGMCIWQMRLEAGTFADLRETGGYVLLSRVCPAWALSIGWKSRTSKVIVGVSRKQGCQG